MSSKISKHAKLVVVVAIALMLLVFGGVVTGNMMSGSSICGNHICESGENPAICLEDCPSEDVEISLLDGILSYFN